MKSVSSIKISPAHLQKNKFAYIQLSYYTSYVIVLIIVHNIHVIIHHAPRHSLGTLSRNATVREAVQARVIILEHHVHFAHYLRIVPHCTLSSDHASRQVSTRAARERSATISTRENGETHVIT